MSNQSRHRPHLLPGKELYAIHFDPLACVNSDIALLKRELLPLLTFAEQARWTPAGHSSFYLNQIFLEKNTRPLWEDQRAALWQQKIDPHNPNETHALAGWHVLKNYHTALQIWKQYQPPYRAIENIFDLTVLIHRLQTAIKLAIPFENTTPVANRHGIRHLAALTLSIQNNFDQIHSLNRTILKEHSFGITTFHPVLHSTHQTNPQQSATPADTPTLLYIVNQLARTLPAHQSSAILWFKNELTSPPKTETIQALLTEEQQRPTHTL
jgi:hypothetical protein